MVGMTYCRGSALECAKDGIRVNVVCPGATTGEMWVKFEAEHPDRAKLALAKHPLGRVGKKEEVADAVIAFPVPRCHLHRRTGVLGRRRCKTAG